MIIVTDSHVSKDRKNHTAFFEMLESFENNHHDLIFLGDIFELWVALDGYESDIHHNFIDWCREQTKYRTIGFVEGNHEFYLTAERALAFSWISSDAWYLNDSRTLFLHGDQINYRDILHLALTKLLKNKTTKFLMNSLPFGSIYANSFKNSLKRTNNKFRLNLPIEEIKAFAECKFADGVDTIFVGHFHHEYIYCNSHFKFLYILPDWFSSQKVALFNQKSKETTFLHWMEVNTQC